MFLLLILCLCVYDVRGAALQEGEDVTPKGEKIFTVEDPACVELLELCGHYGSAPPESEEMECDGVTYFSVHDPESVVYGFGYAREKNGTAQDILPKIKEARLNEVCSQVYRGREVDRWGGKTSEVIHFSLWHEFIVSTRSVTSFVVQYGLQNAFMCVGLEDLADFCFFLNPKEWHDKIQIGLPTAHPLQKPCQSAYGFDACLKKYKEIKTLPDDRPIIFLSSGRRGFAGAGEFLFQLFKNNIALSQKVNFFFTAISEQGKIDARWEIAKAANAVACREGIASEISEWLRLFDECVKHVGCQEVHKGRVVFAHDNDNIIVGSWPRSLSARLEDKKGACDVFVGWPGFVQNVAHTLYLAQAYSLFRLLNNTLSAGCITGEEEAAELPDRSRHTLICVEGPIFPFSRSFGEWMRAKFQYKEVIFLENDLTDVRVSVKHPLVVGGNLVDIDTEASSFFEILFIQKERLSRFLQGKENGVVISGRMCSKIWDAQISQYGFEYALERGGTAADILAKIQSVKEDFTSQKVFSCFYEKKNFSELGNMKYMSVLYEKELSVYGVGLLVQKYELQNSLVCVSFEDLADFGAVGDLFEGRAVHVGKPQGTQEGCRFAHCFDRYTPGQTIVFCASGRNGFATAGEFLCALQCRKDICAQKPHLYFFVTAISQQELSSGRTLILEETRKFDPQGCYHATFDACTKCVAMADVYDGNLVFAQDKENLLVALTPGYQAMPHDGGLYDVLVNWLPNRNMDPMSVAYRQSAHCLFEEMSRYDAGCITGEEIVDNSKRQRTLLCVNSERFNGAVSFGRAIGKKFSYKAVRFVSCDGGHIYANSLKLVAPGLLKQGVMPGCLLCWDYSNANPR